jgi:hypothetical protein
MPVSAHHRVPVLPQCPRALAGSLLAAWGEPAPPPLAPGGGNGKGGDSNSLLPQAKLLRRRELFHCVPETPPSGGLAAALESVSSRSSSQLCFVCAALLPYALFEERAQSSRPARCQLLFGGPGLLSLYRLHPPSLSAGRRSAAIAQSPGCRRRQSVAGLTNSKSSRGVMAARPVLPPVRTSGRRHGPPLRPPWFIALPAHPQPVQ